MSDIREPLHFLKADILLGRDGPQTEQGGMMNILYTESSPNIGGQGLQAIAQMLACRENSGIAQKAVMHDIRVTHIPFRNSLHLPSIFALRRLIVAFRPDIVVCHSGHDSNITGLARGLLCGRLGRFGIVRQKTYLTAGMKMFSLNNMCDVVAVPSAEMRARLIQNSNCRQPVAVVPPGTDFARLRREAEMALPQHIEVWLKSRAPAPVIVQTAMIRPEKGHDFMLRVLHRLKQQGRHFYWLIAGSGRQEDEARLRADIQALGMEDCVLMCGLLSPVAPLYRVASLMVLPSRNEAFGMAIVEAAASGVPVMASFVGGIPSVIQNGLNGTLLPPDDEAAWVDALKLFFSVPEYACSMALQAQNDMESRYSISGTAERLLTLGKSYRYIRWGREPEDNFHDEKVVKHDAFNKAD
ncbi:UNVERIFIED_ORG: glycosyltransferase involved in cell wall biosynthesis [Citrobacter freundii]